MIDSHDHTHCIHEALTAAKRHCGKKLTPLRQQVLATLWSRHHIRGAYDILAEINENAPKPLAPLSVYRALDYLVAQGLAHRIESLNAFIGCPHPTTAHALQFLICSRCHTVTELSDEQLSHSLTQIAQKHQFTPRQTVVEVLGLCARCA